MMTVLETLMCLLAALLVIGLCCVACAYNVWFSPSGYAAERRMFETIVSRSEERRQEREPTEHDSLLASV